jgi:D-Tyr-tRNAtyr deacylase
MAIAAKAADPALTLPHPPNRLAPSMNTSSRKPAPQEFVETGVFQAHMAVSLTNDGPVTFMLETGNPS